MLIGIVLGGCGLFGGNEDSHALAFEHRHLLHLAVFFEVVGKTQQEHFALFLKEDASSAEENIGFDLVSLGEEAFGMFELEVVVVIVGLGSESDFLDVDFDLLCLELFLSFFLLIEELGVVYHTADRRHSVG